MEERKNMTNYAIYNPHDKPVGGLPVIYGFNNGGSLEWYEGCLISQDGVFLGSHICSHEGFMRGDLGVLEGSRPDRHEAFKKHYPEGYRMDFVSHGDARTHAGLQAAFEAHKARQAAGQPTTEGDAFAKAEVVLSSGEAA
jgi:hypothetical protein